MFFLNCCVCLRFVSFLTYWFIYRNHGAPLSQQQALTTLYSTDNTKLKTSSNKELSGLFERKTIRYDYFSLFGRVFSINDKCCWDNWRFSSFESSRAPPFAKIGSWFISVILSQDLASRKWSQNWRKSIASRLNGRKGAQNVIFEWTKYDPSKFRTRDLHDWNQSDRFTR